LNIESTGWGSSWDLLSNDNVLVTRNQRTWVSSFSRLFTKVVGFFENWDGTESQGDFGSSTFDDSGIEFTDSGDQQWLSNNDWVRAKDGRSELEISTSAVGDWARLFTLSDNSGSEKGSCNFHFWIEKNHFFSLFKRWLDPRRLGVLA
jgi:hypothetical protein